MHELHFFFDAGAVMVGASLLLAIAAVARTVWLRARPAGAPGAQHSSVSSSWTDSLLLLAVALSLGRVQWLGRWPTRVYVILSGVALLLLAHRGVPYPDAKSALHRGTPV